jgi:glycosyltransferase involved in cell wall biosynthesis
VANPITIMHLRASNFVGGPEKQVLEHCKRLNPDEFKPLLCTFGNSNHLDELFEAGRANGICSFQLSGASSFDPHQISKLINLFKQHSVKLLVTHGYKATTVGFIAARKAKMPIIVYSHGWTGESFKVQLYEFWDRQLMKWVSHIVAVSEGHKRQLIRAGLEESNISVVHNAVFVPQQAGDNALKQLLGLPDDTRVVVSAGRLSPEKNFSGLIDAACTVLKRTERVCFVVFGEGSERKRLEDMICVAGLQSRFFLPGFRSDIPELLPGADLFVSSSHTEGLPVAVLEAAGAGLPVVATDVGGTGEVILHNHNGLLVNKGDMSALAEAILAIIEQPEKMKLMGTAGACLVKEQFNFDAQAVELAVLYRKIMAESHV